MKTVFHVVMLLGLLASQFDASLTSHAQTADPTVTPTVQSTPAEGSTPEATPAETGSSEMPTVEVPPETGTPVLTYTPASTEIASVTGEPSVTPIGTAVPSLTPPTTPSVTATESAPTIQLTLTPTPQFITPGGIATLHWAITGIDPKLHMLRLQMVLPDGVTPTSGEGAFEKATGTLSVPATAQTGQFHLSTADSLQDVSILASLLEGSKSLAIYQVTIIPHEEFTVPTSGGTVSAMGGKLKITFPAGALPEDAIISVGKPDNPNALEHSLSGHPFEITARGLQSNSALTRFSQDIQIEATYADFGIEPGRESELYMWWYNPAVQGWEAISTTADARTGVVRALTNHFSVFEINLDNWQATLMPRVDDFQVSTFTGAATYSLPLQVQEGPGGLKPDLTLAYNSQVVDQSMIDTQPDWVGMGWSLDTGSIMLDQHGTDTTDDDTWLFNAGGVSTRIVRTDDSSYRMLDQKFWKIARDTSTDSWTAYDKNGNIYSFELQSKAFDGECGYQTYQWSLTSIENAFHQKLTYQYAQENKTVTHDYYNGYFGEWRTCVVSGTIATYPSTITYPGGLQQIRFTRVSRQDYPSEWLTDAAFHSFQKTRLFSVIMEEDQDQDQTFTTMRKYVFGYADNSYADIIFPGHTFSAGGKASTLISVQMYGTTLTPLPATTFTYDKQHLKEVNNGYGGSVTVSYETPHAQTPTNPFTAPGSPDNFRKVDNANIGFHCGNWTSLASQGGGTATCQSDAIRITGAVRNAGDDTNLVRPGSAYTLTVVPSGSIPAGVHVRVGFYTSSIAWACGQDENCLSQTVYIYPGVVNAEPLIQVTGGTVAFTSITYKLMPTFYRVTARTVRDGTGAAYTYHYRYDSELNGQDVDSGAMNNVANAVVCNSPCKRYFPLNTEFLGNSTVTETDPNGKQTITNSYQGDTTYGDARRGLPISITEKSADPNAHVLTETLYHYDLFEYADTYISPSGFGDVQRYRVLNDTEETHVYRAESDEYQGILKTFGYGTYGNRTSQTEQQVSYTSTEGRVVDSVYRSTITLYNPNETAYIVGLPARERITDSGGHIKAETLYLYDGSQDYTALPTVGKLTGQRTLLRCDDDCTSAPYYRDERFEYDTYGNRTTSTVYTGEGTPSLFNQGSAETTYTCYGSGGTLGNVACTDDKIHAYLLWTGNALTSSQVQVTKLTYDYSKGVPLTESDPNDSPSNDTTITATYDPFGRITSLKRPLESETATLTMSYVDTYPFTTTITQHADGSGGTAINYSIVRQYDGLGRQTQSSAGRPGTGGALLDPIYTTYAYDAYGRVVSQSVPYRTGENVYSTTTTYDLLGRPAGVTAPDGTSTVYSYDELTTTVTVKDASDTALNQTVTTKDVWGNVRSLVAKDGSGNQVGPSVSYDDSPDLPAYDILGHLQRVSRGGVTVSMTYDRAGRRLTMSDPDLGYWTYTYDAAGNLKTQVDARNCTLTLGYDLLNRLTSKESSGAGCGTQVSTSYTYDQGTNAIGRRTSMSSGTISNSWTYDVRGRVMSATVSGYTTQWTYKNSDLPETMTYPGTGGEMVTYAYNDHMLLKSLTGTATYLSVPDTGGYDSAGRLLNRTLGSGLVQNFVYFPWNQQGGRLQLIKAGTTADNTSLQKLEYNYDAAGNVDWINDWKAGNPQWQDYGYDALNRLTSANVTGGSDGLYNESYTYDATTGNLATKAGVTYAYNDAAHKHAVTDVVSSHYTYDANGNMITRTVGGQTYNLSYDAENRLASVSGPSLTASFVYDGDGNRVQSAINGISTTFVGNYYEVTGSTITKYYYAGASRVAMNVGGAISYLLSDQLGSTSITALGDGTKVSELRYKAWGEVRYTSGTTATNYQYTGQYAYASLGLDFYVARFYDPALGRFIQADTVVPGGVQGYDRYAYGSNNPSSVSDPSGHKPCWATAHYSCDKRDVTDWLARALTDSASSNEIKFVASYLFGAGKNTEGGVLAGWAMYFQLTRPGGKYDVKLKIAAELEGTVKIGSKWYEYSTTGNILFGYYSHAAGFQLEEIQQGAGVVQRVDYWYQGCPDSPRCHTTLGTEDTYYDSPDDFSGIQFGYELYGSPAAKDGRITADELTAALDDYVGPYPLDVRPAPPGFLPGGPYPTNQFYQW